MQEIQFKDFDKALPLDKIDISESNVRKSQRTAGLEELKQSISRFGLIHPVIVIKKPDGRYKLIVGQRRYLAFKDLGRTTIPALIIDPLSSKNESIVSFGENIHRRALPYDDTIRVCSELFQEYSGPKIQRVRRIASELGIHPNTVSKYLGYQLIPDDVQQLVEDGKLTRGIANRITAAFWPNTEKITRIAKQATRMTKSEWERVLDLGQQKPEASVDEIVDAAKKPPPMREIIIPVDSDLFGLLEKIARKREMDVVELIKTQITRLLDEEGAK